MGLLKKLVGVGQKPFKTKIAKSLGMTYMDPLGKATGAYKNHAVQASAPDQVSLDPNEWDQSAMGDATDPSYGSFTQPFDAEEFYKYQDPGYWFRLQQGKQAVMNGAAAGSGALSGAALKDLIGYNQDAASQEYGNAFNRYQTTQGNIFNRLFSLAQLGQAGAANTGAAGTSLAGNAGQAVANAGAAQGAGIVGAGNALTGGATNAWLWNQFSQPSSAGASRWSGGMPYAGANV